MKKKKKKSKKKGQKNGRVKWVIGPKDGEGTSKDKEEKGRHQPIRMRQFAYSVRPSRLNKLFSSLVAMLGTWQKKKLGAEGVWPRLDGASTLKNAMKGSSPGFGGKGDFDLQSRDKKS